MSKPRPSHDDDASEAEDAHHRPSVPRRTRRFAADVVREAALASWELFKLMIPVIIIVKILQELGFIDAIARLAQPVMALVGLPESMGLVWGTAMLTNIYGGLAVFANLAGGLELTVADVTVLGCMILIAHSLPIELRIGQRAGARLRALLALRLIAALIFGALLNLIFSRGGWLNEPATIHFAPVAATSLGGWAVEQLLWLVKIFLIVLALMLALRFLDWLGLSRLMNRLLRPLLIALGIGPSASTITVFGLTLGIGYGGALIIREARAGHIPARDAFCSLALLSLCHGIFEDTALMVLIGGDPWFLLLGRFLFAIAAMALLVRALNLVPDAIVKRHILRPLPGNGDDGGKPDRNGESAAREEAPAGGGNGGGGS